MHLAHGSGTLSIKDNNLENILTKQLIDKVVLTQKMLIKKALKILKPGHEMVYSTCSILSCENEQILQNVLKQEKAQIVPIELEGKQALPILPTSLKGTLCIMPTDLYEGFFIAKIRK